MAPRDPTAPTTAPSPSGSRTGAGWPRCPRRRPRSGHSRKPDGRPSSEIHCYRAAPRPLAALYGDTFAADFGPLRLKATRERMIVDGWARTTINAAVARIQHVFRWAVAEELAPGPAYQALVAVAGLAAGRTPAPEPAPLRAVTEREVEAELPHRSAVAAALVRFMLWTGCRPGEAVALRGRELDRTGPTWCYRPALHKTAWRGKVRAIWIGPQAQAVLAPFLKLDPDAPVFDAADELRGRSERRRAARATPLWPGHLRLQARKRAHATKDAFASRPYTESALRRAITRACLRAGIEPWAPKCIAAGRRGRPGTGRSSAAIRRR